MTATTHDPYCPVKDKPCHAADNGDCPDEYGHFPSCPQAYCCCDLIARVRADERERAAERVRSALEGRASRSVQWHAVAAARGGESE